MNLRTLFAAALILAFAGCSTTQDVVLAKASGAKPLTSVALRPDEGNSKEMTAHLTQALVQEGIAVRGSVPAGEQKATGVDAVVSYVDVWRWDLVMYLQKLSVRIHDAENGDLLAMGNWADSPLHGFRDAKLVVEGIIKEMVTKLRAAAKK